MTQRQSKAFTGYHMAAILILFFGIVILVNLTMASLAVRSFGGTVVDNSYVASQSYNRWLAEAGRQERLGWTIKTARREDRRLTIAIDSIDDRQNGFSVTAKAVHPLGRAQDIVLVMAPQGSGRFVSEERLPLGRWIVHVEARRGADRHRSIAEIL